VLDEVRDRVHLCDPVPGHAEAAALRFEVEHAFTSLEDLLDEDEVVRHGDDVLSNIDPLWYFRKPRGGPLYDMAVYDLHTVCGGRTSRNRGDACVRGHHASRRLGVRG
jgi:predicted dehydrogenase